MKKNSFLKLLSAFLVIITVFSVVPTMAADSEIGETTENLLDFTIDFETGKRVKNINGTRLNDENEPADGNISKFATEDIGIRTPWDYGTSYHSYIEAAPADSTNYALGVKSANSYFALYDVNKKLPNGDFTVSADFYLAFDNPNATLPLIQWVRNADMDTSDTACTSRFGLISVDTDRRLVTASGPLDVLVDAKTWYNITVAVKYVSGDTYELILYLNGIFIGTYNQDMPAPTSGADGSYIVFFSRASRCYGSYVDNIHVYEWGEGVEWDNSPMDTTINFENCDVSPNNLNYVCVTDVFNEDGELDNRYYNIADKVNTKKAAVTFPIDNGNGYNANIKTSPTDSGNKALKVLSGSSYIAIEDLDLRLYFNDFIASIDIYLNTIPAEKALPLISWIRGTGLSNKDTKETYELVQLNTNGQLVANSKELGAYVNAKEWFNITAQVKKFTGCSKYEVVLYLNGKLLYTYETEMALPDKDANRSFIRFLNITGGFAGSFIDNVQVYEKPASDVYEEKDVLWNVSFNNIADGTVMGVSAWEQVSNGYGVLRSNMGTGLTVENGKLKVSSCSSGEMVDLYVGGGGYSPLRDGSVSISFKYTLDAANANADTLFRVLRWRRVAGPTEQSDGISADILSFKGAKLIFCGITLIDDIVIGREYDIKIVINGPRYLADLYIDGKKVVDSTLIFETLTGENISYFFDDAGNRYFTPYTGFVYEQIYDENGNAVANSFVRRFVESVGYGPDMLRFFQSSAASSGVTFYIDDLKVEKVDNTNNYVDFDFTGWSMFDATNGPQGSNKDSVMATSQGSISFAGKPTVAKKADGDEYLTGNGIKRFFIGDNRQEFIYKGLALEFDLFFTDGAGESKSSTGILNLYYSTTVNSNPYSYTGDQSLLKADGLGKLYTVNNKVLIENASDQWNKMRIELVSQNDKWTAIKYYVNDELAVSVTPAATGYLGTANIKDFIFRFIANNTGTLGWDNVRLYSLDEVEPSPLKLDFSEDYQSVLSDSFYKFPALNSTRTDSTGKTGVVQAQVITNGDVGFLRVDHTNLKSDQNGYFLIEKEKLIGNSKYMVETEFRYTCETGYGVDVVTLISDSYESTFTPVGLRGNTNTLYVNIRGANYNLYTKSGKPITVNNSADDNEFTKVVVFVDDDTLTYTVYVNESMAYYYYNGRYVPCVSLPIVYKNTNICTGARAQLRILDIASVISNDCVLDVRAVTVKATPSGVSSSLVATQNRVNAIDYTYDIRFIAGLDSLYGSKVGFEIEVQYNGNTYVESFSSTDVYTSILEGIELKEVSELGCECVFLLAITDIPQNSGTAMFKVTSFVEHGGVIVESDTQTVYSYYSDGKVIVK